MQIAQYSEIVPTIVSFVERNTLPEMALLEQTTQNHNLIYVTEGYLGFIVDNRSYYLKQGDVLYLPIGCVKKNYMKEGHTTNSYGIFFQYQSLDKTDIELPFPTVFSPGIDLELIELFKELNCQWTEKSEGYVLKSRALFMLLLHRLFTLKFKPDSPFYFDQRMEKIKAYILKNYQRKITIRELSELFKLSPVYLGAAFIKYTDISIREYINRIRINKSVDLLNTGEYTVSEAAYRCGFEDPFYFCKVFKKYMGIPPSMLLRNLRSNK